MNVYILMNGDGYYESVDNVFSTKELAIERIKKLAKSDLDELKKPVIVHSGLITVYTES